MFDPLSVGTALNAALERFAGSILGSVPTVLAALVFLVVAYLLIAAIRTVVRGVLVRTVAADEDLLVDLGVALVTLFLWFGAALTALDILGMGQIAASLGTAAGFVALGVSYALSNMIADTVAGVYLLRDPDFDVGDRVTTESVTGTVADIGLRKSRLRTDDGDVVVLANRDVDKRWRLDGSAADAEGSSA